jgi:hypothetical protein
VELALARATGGSIIHNTAATRLTVIEAPPTNSGATIGRARAIVRVKVLVLVPAAVAPEHAQVVAEQVLPVEGPERDQVAAEPEHAPVAAELELVLAVAVPRDRARQHVRAGPAAPTRWEIVAFPPQRVHAVTRSAAVEAVAAAGIMLEQVAAGVARAWAAAAGTAAVAEATAAAVAVVLAAAAVVVAAAAAVVAAAVAAAAEGRRNKIMISKLNMMNPVKTLQIASTIVIVTLATTAFATAAEPKADASATPPSNQKQFASPKEAADALVQAAASFDTAALKEILGPESEDLVASEDPVQDKNRAVAFAAKAKEKSSLEKKGDHAILEVGKDDFPLPIPIVKQKGKWAFDTKVGKEEILNRRIGSNELDAITVCRGFDDAQKEYAQEKHDDSKVNQYAQKIISTPGKHDGLAWKNPDGTWSGPVGEEVAKALEEGYTEKGKPYHGYYFKVLKKQGAAAPGGEIDFMVGGAMIGGFGLAAAPAEYRVTGVKTFMVGPDGVVYEKDLGPETLKTFQAMDSYNPDKTWKLTEDEWPEENEEQGGTE